MIAASVRLPASSFHRMLLMCDLTVDAFNPSRSGELLVGRADADQTDDVTLPGRELPDHGSFVPQSGLT